MRDALTAQTAPNGSIAHNPWSAFEAGKFTLAANIWRHLADAVHEPASGCRIAHALALTALARHEEALILVESLCEESGKALYLHYLGLLEYAAGEQRRTWHHLQDSGSQILSDAEARQLAAHALQLAGMSWQRRDQARYFAQAAQQYALLGDDQARADQATAFLERLKSRELALATEQRLRDSSTSNERVAS